MKEYNLTVFAVPLKQPHSDVPCGGCVRCCSLSPLLTPEEFESAKYIYTIVNDNGRPVVAIPKTKDGCVYLKNSKCSIYEDRPEACRVFDCRKGHYPPLLKYAKERFGHDV